jgi:uncharacterized protein (TIGR03382 family)
VIEYGLMAGGIGVLLGGVLDAIARAGGLVWDAATDHPVVVLSVVGAVFAWLLLRRR